MKKIFYFLLILINTAALFAEWPLRDAVEFQARDGLPNFFHKIQSGEKTVVGFLGGSITQADGWRPKLVSWLKSYYQNDKLVDYNTAIGGTNSKYGVFRIDRHLLAKDDFDLIFVEFAVNDGDGTDPDVERSIEGIIRKIWQQNPLTDICFVFTLKQEFLPIIQNGKMNLSTSKHDSIAAYYGIPSIFWGIETKNLVESDSVVFYDESVNRKTSKNEDGQFVFTVDRVHPTDFGYQVYADVAARCFQQMQSQSGTLRHKLRPALFSDNYVSAKMLPIDLTNNHGMQLIDQPGQAPHLDAFLKDGTRYLLSENSNNSYEFTFTGSELGINMISGPTVGRFMVEIDGDTTEFNAFDGYCSWTRKQSRFLKLTHGTHHIKIFPSVNPLTLEEKHDILITDKWKKEIQENSQKYIKNEFIFSDIFILK